MEKVGEERSVVSSPEGDGDLFGLLFDVGNCIAYGLNRGGGIVGNLQVEGLLKLHDKLDRVERVGTQVGRKVGLGRNLCGLYAQLLDNNLR